MLMSVNSTSSESRFLYILQLSCPPFQKRSVLSNHVINVHDQSSFYSTFNNKIMLMSVNSSSSESRFLYILQLSCPSQRSVLSNHYACYKCSWWIQLLWYKKMTTYILEMFDYYRGACIKHKDQQHFCLLGEVNLHLFPLQYFVIMGTPQNGATMWVADTVVMNHGCVLKQEHYNDVDLHSQTVRARRL